jgi:hypothetical protein
VGIEVGFTRRATILTTLMALTALAFSAGCRRRDRGLSSMINMADPTTAKQLVSGFHAVESGAWRWTMKKFSVVLKPPAGSETSGAMLRFRMFISPDQLKNLGPITLSADVDGHQLESQTFTTDGDQLYSRPVPPELLKSSEVRINFSLDKAREGDNIDGRQLGVVASLIGLQAR